MKNKFIIFLGNLYLIFFFFNKYMQIIFIPKILSKKLLMMQKKS